MKPITILAAAAILVGGSGLASAESIRRSDVDMYNYGARSTYNQGLYGYGDPMMRSQDMGATGSIVEQDRMERMDRRQSRAERMQMRSDRRMRDGRFAPNEDTTGLSWRR